MNDDFKKDNRKALPKFLLVIFGALVFGAVVGIGSVMLYWPIKQFLGNITVFLGMLSHIIQLIWVALCAVIGFGLYFMGKRDYARCDPDSDDATARADKLISWAMVVSAGGIIVSCFWFTATLTSPFLENDMMITAVVGLVLGLVVFTLQQKVCVDQVRRMNPEKKGSVLDSGFGNTWLASCDEAEQLIIYKSAYKSYKVTTYACLAAWFIIVLFYVNTEQGALLPSFLVLGIWLVQTVAYMLESMRLEHKK